jgi:UDP-N-acetylmuramate dehydrogenase
MSLSTGAPWTIAEDASLAAHNTLRVAAHARKLAELHDASALPELLDALDAPALVLGEGSNVLFTGDYDGNVMVMATRGVEADATDDGAHIVVAAGERWDDFVRWTLGQGYAGLENLILIPGTVGAAPIQNIGAYGVEVAQFIDSVEAWDTREARVVALDNAACAFAYRDSIFKHQRDRYIVTAVRFTLPRSHPSKLDYAGLREELKRMGVSRPTPYHVAEAVQALRTRKLPDPAVIGNAGSFFKNPLIDAAQATDLKREHASMAQWPMPDGRVKISAAWLIESCGFKGLREGDAGISNRHALVLVNHGQASGSELWTFAQRVVAGVEARFGVHLDPEPRIIGN